MLLLCITSQQEVPTSFRGRMKPPGRRCSQLCAPPRSLLRALQSSSPMLLLSSPLPIHSTEAPSSVLTSPQPAHTTSVCILGGAYIIYAANTLHGLVHCRPINVYWMDGWMAGHMNEWMAKGWIDGWVGGWMDGRMKSILSDLQIPFQSFIW